MIKPLVYINPEFNRRDDPHQPLDSDWPMRWCYQCIALTSTRYWDLVVRPAGLWIIHLKCGMAAALATTDFNSASVAINVGSSSFGGTTSTAFVQIMFSIANGATPGSFTLRWAQQTADASNTIVKAGSFLLAHKV